MSVPVGPTAVVVPVKAFRSAKTRLASALPPTDRARLARTMAAGVITAAAPLPVWVACDDPEVADWALALGAGVVWRPGPDLNRVVTAAVEFCAGHGYRRVIVAHGDLPRARSLTWMGRAPENEVTLVPDRRGRGTNVLSVPAGRGFRFAYGPGSAARHRAEAERLGLPLRVVADQDLGWDVDVPDDLTVFDGADPTNREP